jgi:hypothetical protein
MDPEIERGISGVYPGWTQADLDGSTTRRRLDRFPSSRRQRGSIPAESLLTAAAASSR